MIEEMTRNHVHIKDRAHVMEIIQRLVDDGPDKLQVCSAFNFTLTNYKGPCTYTVLEEGGLPEEYTREAVAIRNKYLPIESDPCLSSEEKSPHMVEWWSQAHQLLLNYPLSRDMLPNMVSNSSVKLREGCNNFFDQLHRCDIPLLILSAGVGDIVREILKQRSNYSNNMHVVANDLEFDECGKVTGFKRDITHAFNKNESDVHRSEYFTTLDDRTNVLLMGHCPGDLQIANGAQNVQNKLTIGFLNTRVEESLELYKSLFDVVICEDETLDVVNAILKKFIA